MKIDDYIKHLELQRKGLKMKKNWFFERRR